MHSLLNPAYFIQAFGLLGIGIAIFFESGVIIAFFLPGDSLLFTAGILASQGSLNIFLLIIISVIGAIAGALFGYWFGRKVGPALFSRNDSFLFKQKYVKRAQYFYEKYGAKTIILGRFIAVVRTFVPVIAGIAEINYQTFLTYNIFGGTAWVLVLSLLGFWLGRAVPGVEHFILPIILLIIVLSLLPVFFQFLRRFKK